MNLQILEFLLWVLRLDCLVPNSLIQGEKGYQLTVTTAKVTIQPDNNQRLNKDTSGPLAECLVQTSPCWF